MKARKCSLIATEISPVVGAVLLLEMERHQIKPAVAESIRTSFSEPSWNPQKPPYLDRLSKRKAR